MGKVKRPSTAKDLYNNFSNLGRDRSAGPNFNRSPAQETSFLALNMYRRHLSELAINRFKWMGLPESVDPRFLEVTLFQTALSVFYFDRDPRIGQFVSLRAGALGRPNMMDNPTAFRVFREPLQSVVLTAAQCVPIWANTARTPDHDIVEYFSRRLAQWDTTIEINGMNARQTKIISSDENSRLTMMNVNRQIVEGEPAIYVSDKQNIADSVAVLDLSVDALHLEKLSVVRSRIWSECMGMLGINSASTEKKERVTDDEVEANDDQVQSARNVALNSRKLAAHKINKRFGLKIEVEYNQDIDGEINGVMQGTYVPGKEIEQ